MFEKMEALTGRLSALHLVIVVLSLAMTLGAWLYSKSQLEKQIAGRFDAAANTVVGLIVDRMSRYEDALWSGVASIRAQDDEMSHEEWKAFAESLRIEEKYPGVNGIGVIPYLDRSDVAQFQAARDAEDRGFSIYPAHAQDFLLPITFIEPEDMNAAAVGLDVAHETNRREALLASRDTGKARITGPIVLVQDSGHTPGFLFYTPFYSEDSPQSLAARKESFEGVVYAPFVVRNLVRGLLSQDLRNVRFSIRDQDDLIYDEHTSDDDLADADPWFSKAVEIDMYGRKWVVDIRTTQAFRAANSSQQPTVILTGGLIIEILVIALITLLARANRNAREYAHGLTAELRAKSEYLERANKEIEQFVYVASHDLKTPTRGIGFLADMIEEDLEEGYGPLPPGSAVKGHLDLIRERIDRMNALADGIMEYSRVGQDGPEDATGVSLRGILHDCVADFSVRPDQLTLDAAQDRIVTDSATFRRVMENLIGNAFKYHPDKDAARVDVRVADLGRVLEVSVKDNGRGIAPEFHGKIFEVFQTLQVSDVPDSTGIGLAIVKKAVLSHGGEIEVKSEPGDGVEFIFQWPNDARAEISPLDRAA